MALRVVVVDAFVNLPEIEVVGPKTPQRFIQLTQRNVRVAAVRAHFGHQEHRVPAVRNGASHSPFALAVVIFPGDVEEVYASVDPFMNDPDSLGDRLRDAKAIPAEPDKRAQ